MVFISFPATVALSTYVISNDIIINFSYKILLKFFSGAMWSLRQAKITVVR